jgi:hypothetical protein
MTDPDFFPTLMRKLTAGDSDAAAAVFHRYAGSARIAASCGPGSGAASGSPVYEPRKLSQMSRAG